MDYMIWVYDLESSVSQSETVQCVTIPQDEYGAFEVVSCNQMFTFGNAHKANLVVFRNVFDPSSEQTFYGADCLDKFVNLMLTVNQGRNICIAHNASGYDTRLIFDSAIRLGHIEKIKPIRRGSKFLELRIRHARFRDSLLFLPSSLANLAKSFNLSTRKGFFNFNHRNIPSLV
jgi:abortive infection bacteriophage resistance protein